MEWIQSLLDSSTLPWLTAFLLGLLTALSPCPLATNIAAIGYLTRDIENKHKIFRNGLLYTLGRVISYTVLGVFLIALLKEGSSIFAVQQFIANIGTMVFPPLLIVIGLFLIFIEKINLPQFSLFNTNSGEQLKHKGGMGALFLGCLFALAFCPSSGVFYFGMLIPMSAFEAQGFVYPFIFAVATSLPVILVAWILAYSVSEIGKFYKKLKVIQYWLRIVVAILFILIGIYYLVQFYF